MIGILSISWPPRGKKRNPADMYVCVPPRLLCFGVTPRHRDLCSDFMCSFLRSLFFRSNVLLRLMHCRTFSDNSLFRRSLHRTFTSTNGSSSDREEDTCTKLAIAQSHLHMLLTPLSLRSDVLIQIQRNLILLKLKLQPAERFTNDERACLSAKLADLSGCYVFAC
jgi:hypothetical protein